MSDADHLQGVKNHWDRDELGQAILDALLASGKSLDALTLDDLAPFDQFHGGGKAFTTRLARLADLKPRMNVLDAGGGLGGPARILASEYGCRVTVVDLSESYVQAGIMLTDLMGLNDQVKVQSGNALQLPFEDHSFDALWTQNSGMNIDDKESLYAGFHRVIRPKGLLAIQEPMSGPNQPAIFPVMWSRDGANHFVRTPEQMRAVIEASGFHLLQWDDITNEKTQASPRPVQSIQRLVMGDDLLEEITQASKRNDAEQRLILVQAVFERI